MSHYIPTPDRNEHGLIWSYGRKNGLRNMNLFKYFFHFVHIKQTLKRLGMYASESVYLNTDIKIAYGIKQISS